LYQPLLEGTSILSEDLFPLLVQTLEIMVSQRTQQTAALTPHRYRLGETASAYLFAEDVDTLRERRVQSAELSHLSTYQSLIHS